MMLAESLAAGWFGLVGVVLGGILTAGLTLYLDHTHWRRDANMARRLARSDLHAAEHALSVTETNLRRAGADPPESPRDDQQWPIGWERVTWSQSWTGYRQGLAVSMDDDGFERLATAFGFIEQFQNALAASRRPLTETTDDRNDDREFLRDVRAAVDAARES
jgi:hypothetical protein